MAKSEKELVDQFSPKHISDQIPEDTEELKKKVTEVTQDEQPEAPVDDGPKTKKQYTFPFSWTNGAGKTFAGQFTNKILSISERQSVGLMRAKLSGGMPFESMDGYTIEINLITSHLTFSLVEKPSWAENIRKLEDVELLQALYEEVVSHEAMFFGYGKTEAGSSE